MMRLMKHILQKKMFHTVFMSVKVQEPVQSSFRSFSKNAGFTGVRLGFTVVPKDLIREGVAASWSLGKTSWNQI